MIRWIPLAALLGALLLPAPALACAVCFDPNEPAREAFLLTTGLLTFLPLALMAGVGWWLWRAGGPPE